MRRWYRASPENEAKHKAQAKSWYANNKDKQKQNTRAMRYGISPKAQDSLFAAQGGLCACCGDLIEQFDRNTHLDHSHVTGEVRAFLCDDCNNAVGRVRESVERALKLVDYIRAKCS